MTNAFLVHKKNNYAIVQWLKSMSYVINNSTQNMKNSNILNILSLLLHLGLTTRVTLSFQKLITSKTDQEQKFLSNIQILTEGIILQKNFLKRKPINLCISFCPIICFILWVIIVESQQQWTNTFETTFQETLRTDEVVLLLRTMNILQDKKTMDILLVLLVLTLNKYFSIMESAKKTTFKTNNKTNKEHKLDEKNKQTLLPTTIVLECY